MHIDIHALDLAKVDDLARFTRLIDACRRTAGNEGAALSRGVKDQLRHQTSRHENLITLVAEELGEPAGAVLGAYSPFVSTAKPYANIQFLFVCPEYQRRGVARRLMRAFEMKAWALGCYKVTLKVRETNAPAKALYQGLAYRCGDLAPHEDMMETWEKRLA